MVNGEKNVKAGTVGGNSSFLELLSSDCVKAEVVSLERNLKTQIFQQYNSTETQRWITIDQMKKTKLFCHIPGSVGGKTSAPPMSNTPLKDFH